MNPDKKKYRGLFGGIISCIILYWILFQPQYVVAVYDYIIDILSPFIVGAVLAFIMNVPMRGIENKLTMIKKKDARRPIALLLTILLLLLILALVFGLLIPQVYETSMTFADKLPDFFTRVEEGILSFLNDNPELLQEVQSNLKDWNIGSLVEQALGFVSTSVTTIIGGAFSAIGSVASGMINLVMSIAFAIYCLFRKEILARQGRRLLYAFFPEKWADTTVRVLRLANSTFSNFLSGQCLEVCILGSMFAVSMAIFQMPYIPLVSVLVAVTAFIPIVGAFAGCALGTLFILVDNPTQALWFIALFLVLQQIENNLIYPRVVGTSTGLPGMWVLVAVQVGGEVMGVAGMFLMIPIAAVIYVLIREITTERLKKRKIVDVKLVEHPPEMISHLVKKSSKEKEVNTKD